MVGAANMEEVDSKNGNDINQCRDIEPRETSWYDRILRNVKNKPRNFPEYTIQEGKLFRHFRQTKGSKLADPGTEWKLCIAPHQVGRVLQETHDQATAGHLGVKKTTQRAMTYYYWPGMRRDVRSHVLSCDTCQRYKVEQRKPYGQMHYREAQGPWLSVSSDLMGPFPRSKRGFKYLLVFQDCFSKWTEIIPLRAATAQNVANGFEDVILLRYGAPSELIVDNGTQYTASVFENVAKEWGVKIKFTAPYSPQSNPTERQNRVLKTMIAQYVQKDHQDWDLHLKEIMFAVNTAVHESTKFTPAMVNLGRELTMPKALRGPPFEMTDNQQGDTRDDFITERSKRFKSLYERCQKNLHDAFKRQAKYYNLRRRENPFVVGQLVLYRSHHLSSAKDSYASKLAPKFDGPFRIVKRQGYNLFVLEKSTGGKKITAHAKDLKPYEVDGSM